MKRKTLWLAGWLLSSIPASLILARLMASISHRQSGNGTSVQTGGDGSFLVPVDPSYGVPELVLMSDEQKQELRLN